MSQQPTQQQQQQPPLQSQPLQQNPPPLQPPPPLVSSQNVRLPLAPQQPPYDPANPASQTFPFGVVTPEEGPIPEPVFLDTPTFIVCPNCSYRGASKVDQIRGTCSILCYCCSCFTCTQDVQHKCPRCKVILGTYQKF